MTDLRSGLCHGPNCEAEITDGSESEDFCGDECQARWNASHADPPMPPLSINLPGPSLARWTPEGGAPVTPETSTWQPRAGGWIQLDDSDHPDWAWTDVTQYVADAQPGETVEMGLPRRPSVTPTLPSSIQEGDQLVVLMDNRTGTFIPTPPKLTVRLVETGEVLFDGPVEPRPWLEMGRVDRVESPFARPTVPDQRSWFSRLWRWMWLRG